MRNIFIAILAFVGSVTAANAQIRVMVKVDTLCRFFIDGKLQGTLTPKVLHPFLLSAGKHTLRVEDDKLLASATQYLDFSNGKGADIINFNLIPPLRNAKGHGLAIAPQELLQAWQVKRVLTRQGEHWTADTDLDAILSQHHYLFSDNGQTVKIDMGMGFPIEQQFLFEDDGEHLSFYDKSPENPAQRFRICDLSPEQLVLETGSTRLILEAKSTNNLR